MTGTNLQQKLRRIGNLPFKKKVAIGGAAIAVLLIVVVISNQINGPKTFTSPNKQISLEAVRQDMELKNGDTISGMHTLQKATALYYVVSAKDGQRILGAGNLVVNAQHRFSTKLAFDSTEYKGQKGELLIYVQNEQGKRLDTVKTSVLFK